MEITFPLKHTYDYHSYLAYFAIACTTSEINIPKHLGVNISVLLGHGYLYSRVDIIYFFDNWLGKRGA